MHELPTTFTQRQWTYTQLQREGVYALYCQAHTEGEVQRFEVIHVVTNETPRLLPGGKMYEAGEYYPGGAAWGRLGWTHFTRAEAEAHLAALCQDEAPTGRDSI